MMPKFSRKPPGPQRREKKKPAPAVGPQAPLPEAFMNFRGIKHPEPPKPEKRPEEMSVSNWNHLTAPPKPIWRNE